MSDFKIERTLLTKSEKERLISSVPRLQDKKVLIVGDLGVDEYILGQVRRISPEAPVPVLDVENQDQRIGLAGNVAQNVKSLGGEPLLFGLCGNDEGAQSLFKMLEAQKISTEHIVRDSHRPTTRKIRVMAEQHHMIRIDFEMRKYVTSEIENEILSNIYKKIDQADIVVVEDYAKGVISKSMIESLSQICKNAKKRMLVDPHQTHPGDFYFGADLIKPNFNEAVALAGLDFDLLKDHPERVYEVGRALQKKTGAREIVLTRGKEGMTIFKSDQIVEVPTYARKVFDVTGAGDTVIATLALSLAAGLSLVDSCCLANFAAGVVVGKVGCVPCTKEELKEKIGGHVDETDSHGGTA